MTKTLFSLVIASVSLASVAVAAETLLNKPEKVNIAPPSISSTPTVATKPWEVTTFDQNTDRLAPNYQGVDPAKFLELFRSKVDNLKKGEFETSEDFAKRIADKSALLSPLNTIDLYAFRILNFPIKYDADLQTYLVGGQYDHLCQETYPYGESRDWVTCKIAPIRRVNDTYIGSNAYGASRTVDRTNGEDFSLAIPKNSLMLTSVFSQHRYVKDIYNLQDRLAISLERARVLKDMNIAVLLVGRITDARLVKGRGTLLEPRIDSPRDIFITEEAVPFDIKSIVYYVVQSGEILRRRSY